MVDFLMAFLGFPVVHLGFSGAAGGAARWLFVILVDKKPAPGQGLATIGLGLLLGVFVSPFLEPALAAALGGFQSDPTRMPDFAAFAAGVGGVGVMGFILDLLKFKAREPTSGAGVVPTPKEGE